MTKQEILDEQTLVRKRFDELKVEILEELLKGNSNKVWELIVERENCIARYADLNVMLDNVLLERIEELKTAINNNRGA